MANMNVNTTQRKASTRPKKAIVTDTKRAAPAPRQRTNKGVKGVRQRMREMPTRTIFIPMSEQDTEEFHIFNINGADYAVLKGQPQEVPEAVAEIWEHSQEDIGKSIKERRGLANVNYNRSGFPRIFNRNK